MDKQQVNQASWPWQRLAPGQTLAPDWYINATNQEWLLNVERNYPDIIFPQDCMHPNFIENHTCGETLMQHFMDWWNANLT